MQFQLYQKKLRILQVFLLSVILCYGFYAEAFVAAVGTGELTRGVGMVCEECFFEPRLEDRVAFGTDVGDLLKIIGTDPHGERDGNAHADRKGPPDPFRDADDQCADLDRFRGETYREHRAAYFSQLFLVFHKVRYIGDGFDREFV